MIDVSVSEKLRVLFAEIGEVEDIGILAEQLLAVVEAAERLRLALRNDPRIAEQSFGVQSAKPPLDVALAALDEALS